MRADLHIHTTASDGRWTPERVIEGVLAEGIGLFAVADHDSAENVVATADLAQAHNLAFIPAVEISTTIEENMFHILGYGIDPNYPPLVELLNKNTALLQQTDDNDIRKLIELGYPIVYEDYEAYEYDRTRGGFKSYNYLLEHGFCAGTRDFFENIRSLLGHEWPTFLHPQHATALIREAGGVPVLAHPKASLINGVAAASLEEFLNYGIGGVECYSQYHDKQTTAFCVAWCQQHNLVITGGSDYHGGFVGRHLGVPYVTTEELDLKELQHHILNL